MIASDTGQNRLRTGTLGFSDVENHADYSAASAGLSLGGTAGSPPAPSNSGPSSGHNTGGLSPMIPQYSSDSQRGATRSAVAAGTIEVTDTAHQTQDLASLSRETSDTHRTVERNPDLQHTLDQQANLMAAAQAAGEAVLKTVGDIAKAQREAAMEKAAAAYAKGGQEQFQQALDEAHQWGEGGRYRNALHAAGGALVAGLGGGNALAGAAGAGLSSALAPELDRWASEVANSLSTGSADLDQALGNAAANLAAGGLGALVGGGSGAASAANVDRFNRHAVSHHMGLSNDGPNIGKSLAVGGVAGAAAPFFLPLSTLGGSTVGKVVVAGYNSAWAGASAFGATAITQSGSPDLSAGVGTSSYMLGTAMTKMLPGPIGNALNQINQVLSGPAQNEPVRILV